MKHWLLALAPAAVVAADECYTQSWDACTCDDLDCKETGLGWDCIATCHERLRSAGCVAASAACAQYDAIACADSQAWCWNGEGSCPTCRDQECDVRPGAFCHGTPSVCKTSFASDSAATCGAVWPFQCAGVGVTVNETLSVVGDARGVVTKASLTAALSAWDAYVARASGGDCDCSLSGGCQKNDLCLFVQGALNKTRGLPYAPQKKQGFDRNCCAACHEKGPPPPP